MEKFEDYYDSDFYEEEIDEKEEIVKEKDNNSGILSILSTVSDWFIKFGIVVAVILLVYYIFTEDILGALLYVLGLVISFFFGYFFMFLLDKCIGEE